jgi:chorismate-pyruvate lyase
MSGPSALERALADADGTVTTFLEQLVGEPIDAHQRRHQVMPADASNGLGVAVGRPLLHRWAVLRGRMSGRPFVSAQAVLVVDRLPEVIQHRLEGGNDPIGRVFEEEGIAFTRGPVSSSERRVGGAVADDVAITECLLARSYRVDVGGSPVMTVSEWFLPALNEWLGGR